MAIWIEHDLIPAFLFGIAAFFCFRYFPYTIAILSVSASSVMFLKKRRALAFFFIIGAAYAFLRVPVAGGPVVGSPATEGEVITASGRFTSQPTVFRGRRTQDFEISGISRASGTSGTSGFGTLRVVSDRAFDTVGLYKLRLRIADPAERLNPGAPSHGAGHRQPYARLVAVVSEDRNDGSVRQRLGSFFQRTFKPEQAAFLSALTIGERANIGEDLNRAFSVSGLAHILSISGTHFGLLFLLLFWALRGALRHIPTQALERITLHLTLNQIVAALSLPVMLLYLSISGASIPALRSFIMIVLYLVGLLMGRKGRGLHFLLFAALLLVLYEPEALLNLSFELSFLAVFFIDWWARKPRDKVQEKFPLPYVRKAFYVSLAASLGVAPLVAYHFNYMSLISPVSNFIVTPIVGFLLLPLTLFGSLCYTLTGGFVVTPIVGWLTALTLWLVRMLASVPGCSINIAQFPLMLILFFYSGLFLFGINGLAEKNTEFVPIRKRYRILKLAGLSIAVFPLLFYSALKAISPEPLSVTFLDAGHADSAVIETPQHTIVIDTGRGGREAAGYLRARGLDVIDALVITHAHEDHAGGLGYLLGRFHVKEVWDSGRLQYEPPLGALRRTLKRGDIIEAGGLRFYVLHPSADFYAGSSEENNESLVLRLEGKETSFLFASDIEDEGEGYLEHLERSGLVLKSDVLKVPHHGGATSAHEGFLRAVAPKVAVVTSWRKPSERMTEALRGSRILSTRMEGAIKIEDGGEIKTYADFKLRRTTDMREEAKNLMRLFTMW